MSKQKTSTSSKYIGTPFKFLVITITLFILGSIYQLFTVGSGPLASFATSTGTINLVNGLDPEEAAYLQKSIKSTNNVITPPIKVVVANPSTNKTESAQVKVEPVNDGLESSEVAYIQKAVSIDKAVNGGSTGVAATLPVVKVTVTNINGEPESSLVTLTPTDVKASVSKLTKEIETKVIKANKNTSKALNSEKVFCTDESGDAHSLGEQISRGNNMCVTCRFKYASGSLKGEFDYKHETPCSTNKMIDVNNSCPLYMRSNVSPYSRKIVYSTVETKEFSVERRIAASPESIPTTNSYNTKDSIYYYGYISENGQETYQRFKCEAPINENTPTIIKLNTSTPPVTR